MDQFHKADRDQNGIITFDEALTMLRKLNILFDENEVKMLFEVNIDAFSTPIINQKLF